MAVDIQYDLWDGRLLVDGERDGESEREEMSLPLEM